MTNQWDGPEVNLIPETANEHYAPPSHRTKVKKAAAIKTVTIPVEAAELALSLLWAIPNQTWASSITIRALQEALEEQP